VELHESLYALRQAFGDQVFEDPDNFRGALDDFLDEGAASTGDINLLADAVRLGAYRRMRQLLGSGATPMAAVDAAGELLARERGSADVAGSRWACAVLGYATGEISGAQVQQYRTNPSELQDVRSTQRRPATAPDDYASPGTATVGVGRPPSDPWPDLKEERREGGRNRGVLIGVVIAALVLSGVAAVGAVLASRGSGSSTDEPTNATGNQTSPSKTSSSPTKGSAAAARRLAKLQRVSYDGDPLSDVAIQQWGERPADIQVLRSDGRELVPTSPAWASLGAPPAGSTIHRLNGDFDGDGKTDLAVVQPVGGVEQVSVRPSSGGAFEAPTWQATIPGMQTRGDFPISGDFSGDGKMDLVIVGVREGVSFRVMTSTGSGFEPPRDWDGHLDDESIRVRVVPGDINNDGKTDLVVVRTRSGATQVGVLFSEGDRFGALHPYAVLPHDYLINDETTPVKALAGDFNGDGKTDLIVYGRPPGGGAEGHFLMGTGLGLSSRPELWWENPDSSWDAASSWMSVGDFNGDGLADLARIAWVPADHAVGVWVLRSDRHQLLDGGMWGKWSAPGINSVFDVRTLNRVG
jgi:hypothetical protein